MIGLVKYMFITMLDKDIVDGVLMLGAGVHPESPQLVRKLESHVYC